MTRGRFARLSALASFAVLFVPGCTEDLSSPGADATEAPPAPATTAPPPQAPAPQATRDDARKFQITIEDVSGDTSIWTPISPGVWATHAAGDVLFSEGTPDRGEGLERIAEDGKPADLAASLGRKSSVLASGVFDTPVGASKPGAALPGHSFVFEVSASPSAPRLSFATMFGQSNDVFIGPSSEGIPLFDAKGMPLPERDVTSAVSLWDVGTETNEAPDMGPNQAPRQGMGDKGAREGVLARFTNTTRGLPSALQVAKVEVSRGDGGVFTVKVSNVSGPGTSVVTPISPVFWAVHAPSWKLFTEGQPAGDSGLEALAEDGKPADLVAKQTGAAGTQAVGAATVPDGATSPGAAQPGRSYTFTVTPDAAHRFLSIATMFGQSNDAFLAGASSGVALLNADGSARTAIEINDDFARTLTIWDAGTEANEVPGAGGNQGPRQSGPNTGPADANPNVRRYADATNDLAGPDAGGGVQVRVRAGADAEHLTVVVSNTSASTAFPSRVSPLLWAVHDGSFVFFESNKPSPVGIERLAEDGNPSMWDAAIANAPGLTAHAIVNTPDGAAAPGALAPGAQYTFSIPVGGKAKFLTYAQMWGASNDTFLSLGSTGVSLLESNGSVRALDAINADLAAALGAWDAGTEANQASALGPDQGPRQAAPNTGAPEGSGLVRKVDQVWAFPETRHLVRVRVKPL